MCPKTNIESKEVEKKAKEPQFQYRQIKNILTLTNGQTNTGHSPGLRQHQGFYKIAPRENAAQKDRHNNSRL